MKALKIIGNSLFYILIFFLLIFSIANITIQSNNGIPNLFGYGFTAVRSESMDGDRDTSFPKYSLVFIKVGTPNSVEELREDKDILVFVGRVNGKEDLIIHRYIQSAGDFLITKGDNNPTTDPLLRLDQVRGKYIGHIPYLGGAMLFLQTPVGFAVGVLLPLSILLIFQLIVVIRVWNQRSKEKLTTQFESDKDKLRREIEEEILAKLAGSNKTTPNQDDSNEENE